MRSFSPQITRPSLVPLVILAVSRFGLVAAFTQCYYPDGSIPTDYLWEPCTGAEFSSCCIPSEGDVCQDNGLCWYPRYNITFRGACTDRTWNDPACPQDICVAGYEDTWTWSSPCSEGGDINYACGKVDDGYHSTANCTAPATAFTDYRTEATTSSKPTRYTSPPPVDTSLFSVFTSKYTTIITADVQYTTVTTTWESTITSEISRSGVTRSVTGTATGADGSGASVPINGGDDNKDTEDKGKVTISAGVLAGAIAGPVVLLGLLVGLFFYLRKRRALKKQAEAGTRLDSSPPPNGLVGRDQVVPYEVPASEARHTGVGDKYLYTGTTRRNDEGNNAYEMSVQGEKAWPAHHNTAEVPGDAWSPAATPVQQPYPGVRSPAPVYSENNGPAVMPVELDGSDSFREARSRG